MSAAATQPFWRNSLTTISPGTLQMLCQCWHPQGLGPTGSTHSSRAGQRVTKILETAAAAAEEHRRRISTATINMVVRETVNWRQPPTLRGSNRKGRIYYATQV